MSAFHFPEPMEILEALKNGAEYVLTVSGVCQLIAKYAPEQRTRERAHAHVIQTRP
ncbi:MAG: hypothetical protein IID34_13800 [Planctomycetes bacterium]|nr:hypothetical protein [Planctomycetota bacterium]